MRSPSAMKRVVGRDFLTTILKEAAPADLRIVGRMLLHAAIVGVAAGLMGAAFFAALEVVQRLVLEDLGGYRPLRAHGETFLARADQRRPTSGRGCWRCCPRSARWPAASSRSWRPRRAAAAATR